ncbi:MULTISPECIES: DUF4870 domain-containing protein [Bacillaceae]|uniref:DUF4870 domain-containing protein n=1 Tax=Bacillus salipaludis TaxID=2547811 RepID=A0A4R5VPP8_9BACI|nr:MULTISPECIES: DUF4870 domain-containing protein [Bacillaceae]MBI0575981.1 DUF4870 domain-containing protein [Neobacillus cucumis]MDQ6599308.1 DUF4870 domain-containing protein [Bacillus salipaludis]MED1467896.1 DUF4870 domain-containing protein [Bacillus salipaludis]TDK60408.1 DUF4870 domain-containing protein [Bacillus salipaludis]WHY90176.1 DUF4870 domain-containing protein [Neobacillus cucumis]
MVKSEERLLAAVLYIVSFIFPIIGPLVIWLIKKDESSFIDYHGKEYFNFFISYTIYCIIGGILTIIIIGIIALWVLGIAAVVFTIIAAIKAYEGQEYRFPWIFRLIQ